MRPLLVFSTRVNAKAARQINESNHQYHPLEKDIGPLDEMNVRITWGGMYELISASKKYHVAPRDFFQPGSFVEIASTDLKTGLCGPVASLENLRQGLKSELERVLRECK